MTPRPSLRRFGATLLLALASATPAVWAQTSQPAPANAVNAAPAATPPAVGATAAAGDERFTAPTARPAPEPSAQDSNAQRARSQPGNNAPFWRGVRQSGEQAGFTTLPGAEKGVLIQATAAYPGVRPTTAGEAWRQVRNRFILPYGGALVAIMLLALALFHWRTGGIGHSDNDGTPVIERFTPLERAAHWANASAFVVLAVSGIVMAWGKLFLLPILGGTLFGYLTYVLKNAHNFAGPLFAVSLVIVIVTFVRDNLPERGDLNWLLKGGGVLSGQEMPSWRFNAGEKVVFWLGVLLLGLTVVGSGLVLDKVLPGLAYLRGDMQVAHMIHLSAASLMLVVFALHIYVGTVGIRGSYRAMRSGWVDEAWAREHHEWWADEIRAGRIPAKRSREAEPAAAPPARA